MHVVGYRGHAFAFETDRAHTCFLLRSGARDDGGGGEQERRGEERPGMTEVATYTHAAAAAHLVSVVVESY